MSTVRLQLRHITVDDASELTTRDDGSLFIATDDPPPVRTIVAAWRSDASEADALEVVRVIEVPDPDAGRTRGFEARQVETTRLDAHGRVGTELLPSGEPMVEVVESEPIQLGAPAPVVDPDDSIKIDRRERARLEGERDEADASSTVPAATAIRREPSSEIQTGSSLSGEINTRGADEPDSSGADGPDGESGRRRRRGRKKR
jgi:hypothetical protein